MTTATQDLPEVDLLPATNKEKGVALLTAARSILTTGEQYVIEIKDADTYAKAVLFAQDLDRQIKELDKEREGICPPLFTAHRNATSFFNRLMNPRKEMKAAIENAATRWRLEQDRLRRLEEERQAAIEKQRRELNEAHDAAFAEDAQRLAHFLKAWDQAINDDEDRTRAIERKKEEDARLAHAQVAENVGNSEGVGQILNTQTPLAPAPITISTPVAPPMAPAAMMPAPDITPPLPAPVTPPPPPPPITTVPSPGNPPSFVPKIAGVSDKVNWLFKITNKRLLLKSILEDRDESITLKSVTINDGAKGEIGEQVRKLKGACVASMAAMGIEVWPEGDTTISAPRAPKVG